jgi:hypothetical protein
VATSAGAGLLRSLMGVAVISHTYVRGADRRKLESLMAFEVSTFSSSRELFSEDVD